MWPITCIAMRPSALASIRFCGCHEIFARLQRLFDGARAHQLQARLDRGVFLGQRGPGHAHHMPGRRDGGEVEMTAGDDGAVFRLAQGDGDGGLAVDLDDLAPRLELSPAVGRAVLLGVVGVQLLDIEVDVVEIGGGQPQASRSDRPARMRACPGWSRRSRRRSKAPAAPDTRSSARSGPDADHWPGLRRPRPTATARRQRRWRPPRAPAQRLGWSGWRGACPWAKRGSGASKSARNPPAPPRRCPGVGHHIGQPVGIAQRKGGARAQDLFLVMAGQLQRHHQRDGHGIRGPPRRDLGLEQQQAPARHGPAPPRRRCRSTR
jgi:hypothetical protein